MFPRTGFTAYSEPRISKGEYIDLNPFTKSLHNYLFEVKAIVGPFAKGNMQPNSLANDFYILHSELAKRDLVEVVILFVICIIPFSIKNYIMRMKKEDSYGIN
jgi:hypothetical protein